MLERNRRISVRVSRSQLREIERMATHRGVAKSNVFRILLDIGIRKEKLKEALEKYGHGSITLPKAAELAGISIHDMVTILEERKIQYRYKLSDLEEYVKKRHGS